MNMNNDTDHSVALKALSWKALKVARKKPRQKMTHKLLNNCNHSLTFSFI